MDKVIRAGVVALLMACSHVSAIEKSAEEKIIGILDIPSIFYTDSTEPAIGDDATGLSASTAEPRRFNLRDKPGLDTRVVSTIASGDELARHEFAYEQKGALVYGYQIIESDNVNVSDTWYKVYYEPSQSYVWLNLHSEMTFHWLSWLLVDSLVYTHSYWDGMIIDSLGDDALPIDLSSKLQDGEDRVGKEISATVVQFDKWKNEDWMLVVLYEQSPCFSARQQPRVVAAGWMKVYADDQRVNAWYSSRGC